MLLSEIQNKFVFKTKVQIDEENFIVLREPAQSEVLGISGEDIGKNMEMFAKIMPKCIVESTFTREDGTPADGEEIVKELKVSGSMFTEILTAWLNDIPFQSRLLKKAK